MQFSIVSSLLFAAASFATPVEVANSVVDEGTRLQRASVALDSCTFFCLSKISLTGGQTVGDLIASAIVPGGGGPSKLVPAFCKSLFSQPANLVTLPCSDTYLDSTCIAKFGDGDACSEDTPFTGGCVTQQNFLQLAAESAVLTYHCQDILGIARKTPRPYLQVGYACYDDSDCQRIVPVPNAQTYKCLVSAGNQPSPGSGATIPLSKSTCQISACQKGFKSNDGGFTCTGAHAG